jgi:hypothetical protein
MTGESISYTMGLFTGFSIFDRYHFDRRLKLSQITGYTELPNQRFSGNGDTTLYEMVSKFDTVIGTYNELYGGFYQGFFKLFGYDYETFPTRTNKGWSVEMLLKPRLIDEYFPLNGQIYLNDVYPENKNTFFYFGTRAENKYYHHASGSPSSDSGYTRVTESLNECLKTCSCSDTGVTNSRCLEVYNPISYTADHNLDCNCLCPQTTSVLNPDKDPLYDSMSNSFSLRFSGDPSNPKICVKVLKITGDCVVTGITPTTGITYQTGYTVTEYCSSSQIFDYCAENEPLFLHKDHWVLVDCIWERSQYFDTCDLYYRGGLGTISNLYYADSLSNNTVLLIEPPITHSGQTGAQVEIVNLNEKWLIENDYRLGSLKLFVNGKLFYVINGFEEIIPRGLNTEKEKQLGVPFNISWGGGTQGLRESLTFTGCPITLTGLTYIQDPEVMPNQTLSGTSLSALTTNIFIEPNFAGSFDGAISQFRMYTKPLNYAEVTHNFNILKGNFKLFDFKCPNCDDIIPYSAYYYNMVESPTWVSGNFCGYLDSYSSIDLIINSIVVNGIEYINSPIGYTLDSENLNLVIANNYEQQYTSLDGCVSLTSGFTYTNFVNFLNSTFSNLSVPVLSAQTSYVGKFLGSNSSAGFYIIYPSNYTFTIQMTSNVGTPRTLDYTEIGINPIDINGYYKSTNVGITIVNGVVIE